jgi:hypothetical protein
MLRQITFLLLTGALILAACAPQSAVETDPAATNPGTDSPAATSPATGSPDDVVTSPGGSETEPPLPAPWQPSAQDKNLSRGEAFVNSAELLTLESFPPQYMLTLRGSLPTPCHQLRVEVAEPDASNQIVIEVYSVVDPNQICVQMLEAFEENIPLGSFPTGQYTLTVNDQPAGEIEAP